MSNLDKTKEAMSKQLFDEIACFAGCNIQWCPQSERLGSYGWGSAGLYSFSKEGSPEVHSNTGGGK
mgnify:CR=1 FL=1